MIGVGYMKQERLQDSAVIISCPFSDFGAEHPQMEELLNICDSWNVSVLIDMAYFGM